MTPRGIITELNRITSTFTAPDISPIAAVQMAYFGVDRLRRKLADEIRQEMFANRDPGFEVVPQEEPKGEPKDPVDLAEGGPINKPVHYNSGPPGIECIDVAEHYGFNLGSALKYIWRCDHKGNAIEDLEKASFYIRREIERRTRETKSR